MKWMRLVVENRLSHPKPNIFLAKKGENKQWDIFDIITAKDQFDGFDQYPTLTNQINSRISEYISIANDYSDGRREKYYAFVKMALDISKAEHTIDDPCPTGLYGWRTEGSSDPGGQYKVYQNLARQTFYTIDNTTK